MITADDKTITTSNSSKVIKKRLILSGSCRSIASISSIVSESDAEGLRIVPTVFKGSSVFRSVFLKMREPPTSSANLLGQPSPSIQHPHRYCQAASISPHQPQTSPGETVTVLSESFLKNKISKW